MLGRPHEVRGKVVLGDQRGRLLGFPTANVEVPNSVCMPADGVYAGWYERPGGDVHPCALNLGRRPTFYEHADHSLLEAHLLDFSDDIYGEQARVRFGHFLRSERKFDGIEAIKAQLGRDVEHARQLLADDATQM
jgi:riboflavin kinase/FMN adenylyltransferase